MISVAAAVLATATLLLCRNALAQDSRTSKDDADGKVDFPDDPECTDPMDLAERENPCGDLLDNDGDGLSDFPGDPGCRHAQSTSESPSCNDGLDNDGAASLRFLSLPPVDSVTGLCPK